MSTNLLYLSVQTCLYRHTKHTLYRSLRVTSRVWTLKLWRNTNIWACTSIIKWTGQQTQTFTFKVKDKMDNKKKHALRTLKIRTGLQSVQMVSVSAGKFFLLGPSQSTILSGGQRQKISFEVGNTSSMFMFRHVVSATPHHISSNSLIT